METTEKQSGNNYLNNRQNYDLVTWMKNNQISLQQHEATALRAADMASLDLGFTVTEGNIRGKLEQFPECRWKKSRAQATESQLAERVTSLERDIVSISKTLANMNNILSAQTSRGEFTHAGEPVLNANGRLFQETR